jgi:hypothetical protein
MMTRTLILLAAAGVTLSGCGSFRNAMGLEKSSPDELAIVREAPLVVPPDFNLRPPRPGAPRPMELDAQGQAVAALFGPGVTLQPRSAGENAVVDKAGAARVSPDIRSTVRDDGTVVADKGVFLKDILEAPAQPVQQPAPQPK